MKYRVIQTLCQQEPYPVRVVCRVLQVAKSGYYAWLRSPQSACQQADTQLLEQIEPLFRDHRQRLGSPRIHALLRQQDVRVSKKRVARLMHQAGLVAKHKQTFRRPKTTQSGHGLPVAPNRLNREFTAERPNQKWVSDFTYLRTDEGWLYFAAILDVFSRRAIGWAFEDERNTSLTEQALRMALAQRQPEPSSLLHHSDRGIQYVSEAYRTLLRLHEVEESMSAVGCAYDNALIESFFATFKVECGATFPSRAAAELAVFDYVEGYYNRCRPHSALGYLTPEQYEQEWVARCRKESPGK
jgi:transposase InsO family protein